MRRTIPQIFPHLAKLSANERSWRATPHRATFSFSIYILSLVALRMEQPQTRGNASTRNLRLSFQRLHKDRRSSVVRREICGNGRRDAASVCARDLGPRVRRSGRSDSPRHSRMASCLPVDKMDRPFVTAKHIFGYLHLRSFRLPVRDNKDRGHVDVNAERE